MALGHRMEEQQASLWIGHDALPRSKGHAFYGKLNPLLREAGFDRYVETLCEPHYHDSMGRPGIPPGVYFRMLLIGYFEGIGSQRGIAWRCADSLSLREFLGIPLGEETPDHSSLTRVRDRLTLETHQQVFCFVLGLASLRGLLKGKTVGVDSTTLEADAAMKSIVRRDTGEDWREYVRRLMQEAGEIEAGREPTTEELARFDKKREGKKTSNQAWQSETDPDSRIAKMKDGRTHLAYKAEHVVDLEAEMIVAAEVYPADMADVNTLIPSLNQAQENLVQSGSHAEIEEVVTDKGYPSNETLAALAFDGIRTYVSEPKQAWRRNWKDKPEEQRRAVLGNRRRVRGKRGRRLQRQRSEKVERSFAHVCGTGGSRRSWLRGLEKVKKRYLISAVAHNLGVILRSLFGIGTARSLQGAGRLAESLCFVWRTVKITLVRFLTPRSPVSGQKTLTVPQLALAA